jgi:excisionase family DNA binding protein
MRAGEHWQRLWGDDPRAKAVQEALRSVEDKVRTICEQAQIGDEQFKRAWEAEYGRPYPADIDDLLRQAMRAGVSPDAVRHEDPGFVLLAIEAHMLHCRDLIPLRSPASNADTDQVAERQHTMPMTAQQAADFTGWSVSTVNRKIRDHELSVVNLEGGKYRFVEVELDQLKATKTAQKRRLNKADS